MTGAEQLEAGVNFFNARRYYEAHEVWEDLWRGTFGPLRQFYQGLIQAAVGLHHLQRNNAVGGRSQLRKAIRNLKSYGEADHGLDAGGLILQLEAVLDQNGPIDAAAEPRIARLK